MKRLVIGSTDRADFPALDLYGIRCKIDTGAQTSSIHCHHVKFVEKDGKERIKFKLLDPEHTLYNNKRIEFDEFDERKVRSSSGHAEMRWVIKTKIILFGQEFDLELTLADREKMRYPVLLGKKFLQDHRIMVDVTKSNLSGRQKARN